MREVLLCIIAAALVAMPGMSAAQAPALLPVEGYLSDQDGNPLDDDTVSMKLSLYAAASATETLFEESQAVTVEGGWFSTYLGTNKVLDLGIFREHGTVYLGITVGGDQEILPRFEIATAPYAAFADFAVSAGLAEDAVTVGGIAPEDLRLISDDVDWADLSEVPEDLLDGDDDLLGDLSCGDGQIAAWDDGDGAWACAPDADLLAGIACGDGEVVKYDVGSGSWACGTDLDTSLTPQQVQDIVATAGYALSGELAAVATSGSFADLAGVPDDLADGDGDLLAATSCGDQEVLKWDAAGGTWICAADLDTRLTGDEVSAFVADDGYALAASLATVATSGSFGDLTGIPAGLADGDGDLLAGLDCTEGQVPKWTSGGQWECASDVGSVEDVVAAVAAAGYVTDAWVADRGYALAADLSTVATSGSWNDLADVPEALADGDGDLLKALGCASGEIARSAGAGAWECSDDGDTTYGAGAGLSLAGDTFSIDATGCSGGQVLSWSGSDWVCVDAVDPAAVEAGTGMVAGSEAGATVLSLDTDYTDGRYWALSGNVGTIEGVSFLGTTDDVSFQMRVNDARTLILVPGIVAPSIIGGYAGNTINPGIDGAFIGGGGSASWEGAPLPNAVLDSYGCVGGGLGNTAGDGAGTLLDAGWAFVGGGRDNMASGAGAAILGGAANQATGLYAAVGGGSSNHVTSTYGVVAGGLDNTASGAYSVVPGGRANTASVNYATVGGGWANSVSAAFGTICGGGPTDQADPAATSNRVVDTFGFVGGGAENLAGTDDGNPESATHAVVAGGANNTAGGQAAFVGAGLHNSAGDQAVVCGGFQNTASGATSFVGGGVSNVANGESATIGGGYENGAAMTGATVGGGTRNVAGDSHATVGGGKSNVAMGQFSTVSGGGELTEAEPATANRAMDHYCTIGGGGQNLAGSEDGDPDTAKGATVGGGSLNTAGAAYATVGGGVQNSATGPYDTVAGGWGNAATGGASVIAGGIQNKASGNLATIGGGGYNAAMGRYAVVVGGGEATEGDPASANRATDDYCFVGGGANNMAGNDDGDAATAAYATVGGGLRNKASGLGSVVPGGSDNSAAGANSFAVGYQADAAFDGCMVFGDSHPSAGTVACSATDQFVARASGGVTFFTDPTGAAGASLAPGSGTWSALSDRNAKHGLIAVDPLEVLRRVAEMPIQTWTYNTEAGVRHMGPMAQDFHAAFGLGPDERHITTLDADGVALGAIQGLNSRTDEQQRRLDELERFVAARQTDTSGSELAKLAERLDALEQVNAEYREALDALREENRQLRARLDGPVGAQQAAGVRP